MKILNILCLVILLFLGCGSKGPAFVWHPAEVGGGGYITGLIINPEDSDIVYARCDVAGVFRSGDGGKSWRTVNRGMTECHHHQVQSFCMSPHDPDILFRCSGELRGGRTFGTIHRSLDSGETWTVSTQQPDFFGNGPTRMHGEVIAVDPFDSLTVAAGAYSNGVWLSYDGGESWENTGLEGETPGCVVFHPHVKDRLYVGMLEREGNPGRLYLSEDQGYTWGKIYEGLSFSEIVFDAEDPGRIIAACIRDGLQISEDGGRTFRNVAKGLPRNVRVRTNSVAADPSNPSIYYLSLDVRPHELDVPVPIYKSTDRGETWQLIHRHTWDDLTEYPSYIELVEKTAWAISKVRVDPTDPDKLFFTNWYGVSTSEDRGMSWSGHHYRGMETICAECVVPDPVNTDRVYFAMPDHKPFVSMDDGRTYTQYQDSKEWHNGTAIVRSRFNPDLILYAGKADWQGESGAGLRRSLDGGKTWSTSLELKAPLTPQALREDPFTEGRFWLYVDRDIEKGAGLYRSDDWGESWQKLPGFLPDYIRTLPHHQHWIEAELLPVIVGQTKNACGTNQLLCTDPHQQNVLYFGEWTEGIWKTTDAGETWSDISEGLPFQTDTASVLLDLKTDPNTPGVLYAGFIREGLWRTANGGASWTKVFPKDPRIFNASSCAAGGPSGREIVVVSEPLWWSKSPSAVWYSSDLGASWRDITDPSLGAVRWKGVSLNPESGTIHAVACGNGAFYAEKQ